MQGKSSTLEEEPILNSAYNRREQRENEKFMRGKENDRAVELDTPSPSCSILELPSFRKMRQHTIVAEVMVLAQPTM